MPTWTKNTKHTSIFKTIPKGYWDFLLTEDGGFLSQENGDYIILEQSSAPIWTNKAKHTSSWSNIPKS